MSQADDLRAGIAGAREALKVAIGASAAHGNWETAKGSADDGEAGWSPRQVAEHVIPSDHDVRQRHLRRLRLRRPRQSRWASIPSSPTPADAIAALDAVIEAAFDSKVQLRAG